MGKFTDPKYLKGSQYRTPDNLNHRIILHVTFSTNPVLWNEWIFPYLAVADGHKVLAAGCGNATQWRENTGRFPSSAQFTLMDFSIGMVSGARSGIGVEDTRFAYLCGDVQYLPLPVHSYDRVTANHMLYHVPSIEKAVENLAKALKPDGLFIAATNGDQHLFDYYQLLTEFDPHFPAPDRPNRRFSLQNGINALAPFFAEVWQEQYQGDLWVTEARALVDYVLSTDVPGTIKGERIHALEAFFQRKIDQEGGIFIRREAGVFLASKTRGLVESLGVLQTKQQLL